MTKRYGPLSGATKGTLRWDAISVAIPMRDRPSCQVASKNEDCAKSIANCANDGQKAAIGRSVGRQTA